MNYLEFHGTEWEGAELDSGSPTGFVCPGANHPMHCLGQTGDQVRKSLMQHMGNLSMEDTVAEDIVYCLIIATVFKMMCVISVFLKTRWIVPVRPIAAKNAAGGAPPAVVVQPVADGSNDVIV